VRRRKRLDRFVGRWTTEGTSSPSDEATIRGKAKATYRRLPGFFLERHLQLARLANQ